MRITSLIPLALAGACGTSANASLADLPDAHVSVQIWASSDTDPTTGFVTLAYDESAFRATHGGDCAVVDASATLNGHGLDGDAGGDSDEGDECYPPSFGLSGDFAGAQALAITDGTTTIAAAYPDGAFAPHTPTLVSPAQWKLSAGQAVEVSWSAPGDLVALAPEPSQVYFHTGTIEDNNFFDLTAEFAGDRIRWTMPSPLPRTGDGLIVFRFGYANGSADTCTGAASCTYSAERGYKHSVTLAP